MIFSGIVLIFSVVRIGENGVKWAFCRSGYRSDVLGEFEVKCLGNADFTRGLWIEQICPS